MIHSYSYLSALSLLLLLAGCDQRDDPALVPVPVTPGTAQPGANQGASGTLPGGHPSVPNGPSGDSSGQPSGAEQEAAVSSLQWTLADTWTAEAPANEMRLAQWRLPGAESSQMSECAMFYFPGGGPAAATVDHWATQFTSAEGTPAERSAESFDVGALAINTVEVAGTYHTRIPPVTGTDIELNEFALFGAAIESNSDFHLLKCVAPAAVITAEGERLRGFVHALTLQEP